MLFCVLFDFKEELFSMTNRIFDKKNVILLKVNEEEFNIKEIQTYNTTNF